MIFYCLQMSDRVITGKDVLQDLSDARHDDVVFLNPPNDKKSNVCNRMASIILKLC